MPLPLAVTTLPLAQSLTSSQAQIKELQAKLAAREDTPHPSGISDAVPHGAAQSVQARAISPTPGALRGVSPARSPVKAGSLQDNVPGATTNVAGGAAGATEAAGDAGGKASEDTSEASLRKMIMARSELNALALYVCWPIMILDEMARITLLEHVRIPCSHRGSGEFLSRSYKWLVTAWFDELRTFATFICACSVGNIPPPLLDADRNE